MPETNELTAQVARLSKVLDERTSVHKALIPYDEGGCHIPDVIVRGRLTNAYRALTSASDAPWGSLIVDSVQDRLEVAGIRDKEQATGDKVWGVWQDNQMDAESKLAHRSTLLDARAFALVWPDKDSGKPAISLDDCTQMVVQYREGSRRHRVAALRRWAEGNNIHATLYRPDGIYKFQVLGGVDAGVERKWEKRQPDGEDWPLPNEYDVVPVVELAVNRRLKPGSFGYARGEFQHCTGLIDRINLLTFLGLVVAIWMGFPLRGVIGDKILKDDDDNPLPPFESRPDSVVQYENPQAKVFQLEAADRKNLSIFAELDQLAAMSKTPRHYFPIGDGISNIAEPTIRAFEGGLHAKVTGHKASLGEGWEEVLRLAGKMLDEPVELSPRAELVWKDHESRSLAERADAAVKLASIEGLPWQAVAERALNATSDEVARWAADEASSGFSQLLRTVTAPAPVGANGAASGVPAR